MLARQQGLLTFTALVCLLPFSCADVRGTARGRRRQVRSIAENISQEELSDRHHHRALKKSSSSDKKSYFEDEANHQGIQMMINDETGNNQDNCLYCIFEEFDAGFDDGLEAVMYQCELQSEDYPMLHGLLFELGTELNQEFMDKYKKQLARDTVFCIPNGSAIIQSSNFEVTIPHLSSVYPVVDFEVSHIKEDGKSSDGNNSKRRRRLNIASSPIGTKIGLVVRIVSEAEGNLATSFSAEELAGKVWGKGDDREAVNLKSQYRKCSGNAFRIKGATFGSNVVDGVVEVIIPNTIFQGQESLSFYNKVVQATAATVGGMQIYDKYDHILYCMPPGTLFYNRANWVGYAPRGQPSFYNGDYCASLTATMHETGHNIGFSHSAEGVYEYGDKSGVMGPSYPYSTVPQMCFNGQKYMQSGWLSETQGRHITMAQLPVQVRLVAFVDIGKEEEGDAIAVQAGTNYLVYNKKKSFNRGTQEFADEVTVVTAQDPQNDSYAQNAGLSDIGSFHVGANNFTFEICDMGTSDHVLTNSNTDWVNLGVSTIGGPSACDQPLNKFGNYESCSHGEIMTIQVTPDIYGGEITWSVIDNNNGITVASGGPYGDNDTSPKVFDVCLDSNGCYTFQINDGYGDGICCSYGRGFYSVTYEGNLITGGDYGYGEEKQIPPFCIAESDSGDQGD